MKKIYIILCLLSLNLSVFAVDVKALEGEANKLYQDGDYQKAIELYNQVLDAGVESSAVYYNLGNSYYKAGEISKAILNYERALVLNPGDKDTKYNLTLAQKATVDKIKVLPELFFVRWYNSFVSTFSADQWAYFSVALFIAFLIMAALFFHSDSIGLKKTGFTVGIVLLLLTAVTIFFATKQYHRVSDRNYGIVMTPSVVVRGAPDSSGTELFVVHEGLKVQIVESLGDWYNVRMADGNEGWIMKSDLEKI